ncbi:patsas [Carabus blaptoides fortunei]
MVADADHPAPNVNDEKDTNIMCCTAVNESDHHHHHHDYNHSCKTIFDVIKTGEVSDIEDLVEKLGSEVLRARDEWGYTPAHWAALDGSVEIMRYLVERSGPVDLPCLGTQGPKPIHWACRKGHTAVVQVLLQAGVAVNAADFKGLTPLMTACMFGRTATAAYLLGMGALNHLCDINGDTALHWAAYKGHADLIKLLMYSGVNLQKSDHFGSTPLHLACLSGSVQCVKLLCEKSSIELEPLDKNDKTPLMLAQSHRHGDIVQVLQSEKKRRSRWFPPITEIWGLIFGAAGDSKVPLLFFMGSVLLWGYPMYIIRCIPITWNILRGSHYCFIYWNIVMWVCWVTANRKNPGYIPLNSDTYYRAIKQIPYFDKWKKRNILLSRLCHTCRCLRPLRAKHCRICNRCVSYFDHHCPFIYNCVGLRNRMWFFLFVMSVAINCSFTIYFACYCIAIEGFELLYVLGLIEAFLFSGLGWILTCTSILHACMNLTTNEMFNYKRYSYLRDKKGRYLNPFSRGPILNLVEFFICLPDRDEDDETLYEYPI